MIAHGGQNEYVCLCAISERQAISRKYMEQIVPLLCRGGLLESCRGHLGGYRLAKPADEISVADVLRLTEGSLAPVACLHSNGECGDRNKCPAYPVWVGLEKVITDYLEGVKLTDMSETDVCPDDAGNCGGAEDRYE